MEVIAITEIEPPVHSSTNNSLIVNEGREKFKSIYPIEKVPANLRKSNEEAYTPKIISIGPYHRGGNRGIKYKHMYYTHRRFLHKIIDDKECEIQYFYAEAINQKYIIDMFTLDACFIIELFLISNSKSWRSDDPIFTNQSQLRSLKNDFLLLENQFPFVFIEEVFNREYGHVSFDLLDLAFDFFKEFNVLHIWPSNVKIEHFTDLLRTFQLPPSRRLPPRSNKMVKLSYSATQLREVGVKFEPSTSQCILDLKFSLKSGVLRIPCLELNNTTETLMRNILALEQTRYRGNGYVTDYFVILHFLIQSTEDMDLLCDRKIVVNYLFDTNAATSLVKDLFKDIKWEDMNHNYIRIYQNLNKFYHRQRSQPRIWKKILKRDYFSNP